MPFWGLPSNNFGEVAVIRKFQYVPRVLYGAAILDDIIAVVNGRSVVERSSFSDQLQSWHSLPTYLLLIPF